MATNKQEYQRQYYENHKHPCPICGKLIDRKSEFCIKHRKNQVRGEGNPNWKGGRGKTSAGYVWVYSCDHPRAGKKHQVLEHILVWEKVNGLLPKGWQVHHINGIKDDNRLENLIALPPRSHQHSSPLRALLKKAQVRIRELERKLNHENRLL